MGSERRQSPLAANTVRRSSRGSTPLEEMDTLDQRPSYSARTARRYDSDPTFIAAPAAIPDDQCATLRRDKNAAECDASGVFERPSYLPPPAPSSLAPVAVDPSKDNRYIDTVRTRQRERTVWRKKSDLYAARIAVFSGAFASVTVAALVWVLSNPSVTDVHASNAASVAAIIDTQSAPPAVDLLSDTPSVATPAATTIVIGDVKDDHARAATKAAERTH
jgi:hypothetical protein